jgi:hypothetical protein
MLKAPPLTYSKKKNPAWMGPRAGLDVVGKKGILASDWNRIRSSNPTLFNLLQYSVEKHNNVFLYLIFDTNYMNFLGCGFRCGGC